MRMVLKRLVPGRLLPVVLLGCWGGLCQLAVSDETVVSVQRNVEYVRRGTLALKVDVYLPPPGARPAGPRPAVLMVHGGAWLAGCKEEMSGPAREVARRGWVAVALDYRLAPRYPFPAQLQDVQSALRWMVDQRKRYAIDPDRLALYGYSAGAHLACLAATRADRVVPVCAVVAGGSPCEFGWIAADSRALAYWLGGSPGELPERYRQAAPLSHVSADDPPTFFFHGDQDRLVPLSSPRQMHQNLLAVGVTSVLHVVHGKGHLLTFLDQQAHVLALDFLQRQLVAAAP